MGAPCRRLMTVARSTNALAVQATILQSALGCSVRELTRHVLSETLVIVCSGCMNGLDKVKERIVEYPAVQQRASPHCGALYSVTCPRLSKIGSNVAKCVVCLQTMDE